MKENKLIILGVVLFVIIGCYIGFKNDVPLSAKEAKIEREFQVALPDGSNVKDVFSYLDGQKITHGELDPKSHDVIAVIRNVERDGFVITDIQVVLHFDEHDKMQDFVLKETSRGVNG